MDELQDNSHQVEMVNVNKVYRLFLIVMQIVNLYY